MFTQGQKIILCGNLSARLNALPLSKPAVLNPEMLLSDRDQIQSEPLTVVLLVCFLLNETLREENPMGSGCAVCVHSVRDHWAAAAALAGVA